MGSLNHVFRYMACLLFATPLSAEGMRPRVDKNLSAVGDISTTFTMGKVEEVVVPYKTNSPPESSLNHTQFADEIRDIRNGKSTQGRLLRATEDSAIVRPKAKIDAQGGILDDANWAHKNANAVAGKYFTGKTGSCQTPNLPVTQKTDKFCESKPARKTKTCTLTRHIWVDRTDHYRCDKRAATFVKLCKKTSSYACNVKTNKAACIRNNVRFEGAKVQWKGATATLTFASPKQKPGTYFSTPGSKFSPIGKRFAVLARHGFKIKIADRFAVKETILHHVSAKGPVQFIGPNGRPAVTLVNKALARFGEGAPKLGVPKSPNDGLLIPQTLVSTDALNGNGPVQLAARIARYPSTWSCQLPGACTNNVPNKNQPTVFKSGWDVAPDDLGKTGGLAVVPIIPFSPFLLADLADNNSISRNLVRTLDLQRFAAARPDAGKRWKVNELSLRVVYDNSIANGGAAKIKISFDGACCDTFKSTVGETCE